MTKLKIKEKMAGFAVPVNSDDDLQTGTFIYSYNWDMLLLVIESNEDGDEIQYGLLDLSSGELLLLEGVCFEENLKDCIHQFGPFYIVDKAKITFTVGD